MMAVLRQARDLAAPGHGEEIVLGKRQDTRHRADQDLTQSGLAQRRRYLGQHDPQIQGDHDPGLGVGDLVGDLLGGVERVEVDHRAAELEHRVVANHEIGRVRQKQQPTLTPRPTSSACRPLAARRTRRSTSA